MRVVHAPMPGHGCVVEQVRRTCRDPAVLDTHYLEFRKDSFPIPGLE